LIHLIEYHNGSSGSPVGFPARTSVREGAMGTPIKTNKWQWTSSAVGGQLVYNRSNVTIFKSCAAGGSEPIVTSYSYTYQAGNNQIEQKAITLPAVPIGQNGSGISPTQRVRYDQFGSMVWEQSPKGFVDHFSYDVSLGVLAFCHSLILG
jgi:hypothetical protein